MPIKQVNSDGTATLVCPDCGADFIVDYTEDDSGMADVIREMYDTMLCNQCQGRIAEESKIAEKKIADEALAAKLDEIGIPPRFRTEKPFVRDVAVYLWSHKKQSMIISGATGCGKTSSACYVMMKIAGANPGIKARYCSRQQLFADYVQAKKSDKGDSESKFLARLSALDYLIIDEIVGKKGLSKLTDSSQELFFNLIDGVYSQERKTIIWILGNFFQGSIDSLLDDPLPTKRRLNESFLKLWIDKSGIDDNVQI